MSNEVRVVVEGENQTAVRAVISLLAETLGGGEDISVLTAEGQEVSSSEYSLKAAEEAEEDFDFEGTQFTLVERFAFGD